MMKDEVKQLIILIGILVIVIIAAILINSDKDTNKIDSRIVNTQNIVTQIQEENIIDNLKELLEEPTNTIDKEQEKQIKKMIDATSNNGIPTTVED